MILVLIVVCTFVILSMLGILAKYFKLELVRVEGMSMYPTLKPKRPLLIRKRLNFQKDLRPGNIFVYTCPNGYSVVKRLDKLIFANGTFYLWFLGDNPPVSSDSREYGYVGVENLEGIAVFNKKKE